MYNIVLSMSLKCPVYGLCMTPEQDQLVIPFYLFFLSDLGNGLLWVIKDLVDLQSEPDISSGSLSIII